MFRTVPLSIIKGFSLCIQQCHTGLLTACEQEQDGTSWSCSQAVSKPVWHRPLLCVQWKIPDDGERNCLKHVEFIQKKIWEISASSWFYYKNILRTFCLLRLLCHTGSGLNWFRPDPARKLSANLYDIYHCCVYSEKLLMMDRGTVRNM